MQTQNMIKSTIDFSEHLIGHNQIWRILFGCVSIFTIYSITVFSYFYFLSSLGFNISLILSGSTPENLALLLLTFFPVWIGLTIVNKVIHTRPLNALFGPSYTINWRHFKIATIFFLVVMAAGEILLQFYLLRIGSPSFSPKMILHFDRWILWFLPISILLFIQIGAEELFFRGYLLQTIKARSGNIVWAAIFPSIIFGFGHFDTETYGFNAYFYVLQTTVLGIILCLVTLRLGNIGAALGIHFANNLLSCFLLSIRGEVNGMALFEWQVDPKSPVLMISMIYYVLLFTVIYTFWTRKYCPTKD